MNVRAPTRPIFMGIFLICEECCLCRMIKYCATIERAIDDVKVVFVLPSFGAHRLAVVLKRPLRQMSEAKYASWNPDADNIDPFGRLSLSVLPFVSTITSGADPTDGKSVNEEEGDKPVFTPPDESIPESTSSM